MLYPVRKIHDANNIYDVGQDTSIAQEWNQEKEHEKCSVAAKDSEAQWQDVSLQKCLWDPSPFCGIQVQNA